MVYPYNNIGSDFVHFFVRKIDENQKKLEI